MVFRKQVTLKPVDKLTLFYIVIVLLLILFFKENLPDYKSYIFIHIFAFIGLIIFYFFSEKFNLKLIRNWYPLLIVTFFYEETGYLNQIVFKGFWDKFIHNFEKSIFGIDIGKSLLANFNNIFFNEYIYFSYFSYYVIIPLLGFLIYKKEKKVFEEYIFVLMFTYFLCYLCYIIIPIAGPFEVEYIPIKGIFFDKIIHFFYKYGELPGSAMPSSHVAVALIVLIYSKITRNFFYLFLFIFISLSFSTIYLRYHYFLDVEAGIVTGIFCFYSGKYFYKKLSYKEAMQ